ncbi:MAG: phosphatase PAP2 family protein [Elusimicrobiota bacterium]
MRMGLALSLTICLSLCARPAWTQEPLSLGGDISVLLGDLKERRAQPGEDAQIAGRAVAPTQAANWQDIPSESFAVADYPALGSPESALDFRILHDWQEQRSEAACRQARSQKIPAFKYLFSAGSSPLTQAEVAAMAPLMDEVFKLGTRIAGYYKHKYSRPRPFTTDPTLIPCAHKPGGRTSYPSSHALLAHLGACVLAAKYEDRAGTLGDYGDRLGELRAIVGVHHPSDVAAGQDLARQLCGRLLKDDDFLSRLR